MEIALENAVRLGVLVIPALMGMLAAHLRLMKDVRLAISGLNALALYFAFPALIICGLLNEGFVLPTAVGFWLVVPISQLVLVGLVRLGAPRLGIGSQAGTLALVALFGNVAYLGLPLTVALYGEGRAGECALIVSLHVTLAVGLGPLLLARWSGSGGRATLRFVLRQPLVWAPWIGLALRASPVDVRGAIFTGLSPLSSAAAPVALFMLGLYLYAERHQFRAPPRGAFYHVWLRLLIAPALTGAVTAGFVALGLLEGADAVLFVVLAGMPAAITTFAISSDLGIGTDRIAATILWSTGLALATLPVLAALAG